MKKSLLLILSSFFMLPAFASHIVGGEMIYEFVSADAANKTRKYKITLYLFRDELCTN